MLLDTMGQSVLIARNSETARCLVLVEVLLDSRRKLEEMSIVLLRPLESSYLDPVATNRMFDTLEINA
jgi:hypothetical protein